MNLAEIGTLLQNSILNNAEITGVCIDSRDIKPGNLFIAIQGERFDGHDFLAEVEAKGASAIVCQRPSSTVKIPQLQVNDTFKALAQIATFYRQKQSCPVIAITGSNGKTSVKEMIASILPKPSFATPGNLNNHIGAPLSVLKLQPEHRYAVFELGASHRGEIAHTVAVVQPHVALINNIAPAHIEGFGSIDGVADAKGELYQGLAASGTAVVNDDDAYAHYWDGLFENRTIIRFSIDHKTDVYVNDLVFDVNNCGQFTLITPAGQAHVKLKVPGRHNVSNALAAAACTCVIGIPLADIVNGLQDFTGVAGRMTFKQGKHQALIIDDTYNANLRSALTAVEVLAKRPGAKILVLGDMGELGTYSEAHHQQVGQAAREYGIDILMTCGQHSRLATLAFGEHARHYDNQQALTDALLNYLDADTTVLVKGSRSAAMEKIVHQLVG